MYVYVNVNMTLIMHIRANTKSLVINNLSRSNFSAYYKRVLAGIINLS